MKEFKADIQSKTRLDTFLAGKFPAISRSFLQKLCTNNQVLVNDKPEKSGFKIKPQDEVTILYDMDSIGVIDDIELPVIYQDDDVIVIDKPAGVISHARGRYWNEPSVASFIRQLTGLDGERAGIVHRLDRVTSGVMICAKNTKAMTHLQKQFADRKAVKLYKAVVEGHLEPSSAVIDMGIERNPKAPSTFRVGPNGKAAQTQYKVIKSSKSHDLVELIPKTGRTHQLRVHLKQLGHPIVGDKLYGGVDYKRLLLHACTLSVNLPDGSEKTFTAPVPDDFMEFLAND